MTYQEKVAKAEEAYELVLSGSSFTHIKERLSESGIYQYEIDKILSKCQTLFFEKFEKEIVEDLLNKHQNVRDNYILHSETYEWLTNSGIQKIRNQVNSSIYERLRNGEQIESIAKEVANSFYTESEILNKLQCEQEKDKINEEKKYESTRKYWILQSALSLILGIFNIALSIKFNTVLHLTLGCIFICAALINYIMVDPKMK